MFWPTGEVLESGVSGSPGLRGDLRLTSQIPSALKPAVLQGSKDLGGRVGWGKESPAAETLPAGWPKKFREFGGGGFCPPRKVPESGSSGCTVLWPLTHLSGPLSLEAGCVGCPKDLTDKRAVLGQSVMG